MKKQNTKYKNSIQRMHISRLILIFGLFLLVFSFIAFKLFEIQISKHEFYAKKAENQRRKKITIYAPRGYIYDRNFKKMAENIGFVYTFGINTKRVSNKRSLAKRISAITKVNWRKYYKELRSKKGFIWVAKHLSLDQKNEVFKTLTSDERYAASFNITPNRIYTGKKNAGQIIGFVNVDGKGVAGIEKKFNDYLIGKDGWEYIFKDARQERSFNFNTRKQEPVEGNSVVLTINENYQSILEEELETVVKKWKAKKAEAIILDPHTGEILAMGSYPNFDPNNPGKYPAFDRKNKAITDMYEPGSTMKAVSAAILLEEKKVKEDDVFFCSNKGIRIIENRRAIKDSHKHENENLTFSQVISKSSNVGIVKAILRLKKEKYYEYLRSFGFGDKTEINLIGESGGNMPKLKHWSILSQPTMSFGQGISTTPLQMVMAYGAIANGGLLLKPIVVKGIIDQNHKIIEKYDTEVIRRVISENTAKRTCKLLRGVVEEGGTAPQAEIEGLKVAGKTGTSQKVINGKYSWRYYDASFIGMFPYDNPKLVCLVSVDSPVPNHYGGTVAAPAFKNMMSRIYNDNMANFVDKDAGDDDLPKILIPNLKGKTFGKSKQILDKLNIPFKGNYDLDEIVLYQSLIPFSKFNKNDTLVVSNQNKVKFTNFVPKVLNNSLRKAVMQMHQSGIKVFVKGNGNVYRQSLKPGIKLTKTAVCSLFCSTSLNKSIVLKKKKLKKKRRRKI